MHLDGKMIGVMCFGNY